MDKNPNLMKKGEKIWLIIRAGTLYRLGSVDEANRVFDRAADLYGDQMPPIGRNRLLEWDNFSGFIWTVLNFHEVGEIAHKAIRQAIEAKPDDASLHAHCGLLHRRFHRWEEALGELETAIELDPKNVEYIEAAAFASLLAGDFEAANRLTAAWADLSDGPKSIDVSWSVGRIASCIPNATFVDEDFLRRVRASSQARPTNWWRKEAVAGVLYRLGRLDEALEQHSQVEAAYNDPNNAGRTRLQLRRGIILHELGRKEEALNAFQSSDALRRAWMQPPGVFPKRSRLSFVECWSLHRELSDLIDEDGQSSHEAERAKVSAEAISK